ncbi:MAG: bioF [Chitinophagaceae bacterium]|nr:bioF [Chitinophagaceae bacterium]
MKSIFKKLGARKEEGIVRTLRANDGKIDFSSNDYLGLAASPALAEAIDQTYKRAFPHPINGSGGSRLLAGHFDFYDQVEKELAAFFETEAVLIFNSGYSANLAILSTLPQKGDTILMDEYIHASLKDGARLSFASKFSFRHNDLSDLESKLKKAEGTVFIVAESLYSMDGDFAPVEALQKLAEQYGAYLIIDEAHTTGIFGKQGRGFLHEKKIAHLVPFKIYTFGKAMGIHGACIAGSQELKDYLINFARPFIYTTAMPPHAFASVHAAFLYVQQHSEQKEQLMNNIRHWNTLVKGQSGFSANESPIQTYTYPGNQNIRALAHSMQSNNYDVRPILSPTVKEGTERLRICLHAYNTPQEIASLIQRITTFHE